VLVVPGAAQSDLGFVDGTIRFDLRGRQDQVFPNVRGFRDVERLTAAVAARAVVIIELALDGWVRRGPPCPDLLAGSETGGAGPIPSSRQQERNPRALLQSNRSTPMPASEPQLAEFSVLLRRLVGTKYLFVLRHMGCTVYVQQSMISK